MVDLYDDFGRVFGNRVQNPRTIDVLGHFGRIQILMFL